jgi:integrase|tara:strand:+ start:739 stop:1794 length:1056 start_codon:yes stop_codon:yes gene_type:complete
MARPEGNKWRADVCINGKRKSKICATEEEAKKVETDIKHQLIDGKPLNKVRALTQITLKEAFENCLNNREVGWIRDGELTAHGKKQKYYANAFYEFFGANKSLRDIKLKDWYGFIDQYGDWTATNNRRACCMNKIFTHAFVNGHITADNHLKIKRKKEKLTRLKAYTRAEEVSILNECDTLGYLDLKDFVICLIDTGASPEDLRTANHKNLLRNPDGSVTFNFNRAKTGIPVTVGTRKRTQDILLKRSNYPQFFTSSYRVLYNKWNDIRERLGHSEEKDWVFYTCRHTCASRMGEAGYTLTEVADWLGHAPNSPVTRRYIHFFPAHKINIARKMDKFEENLNTNNVRQIGK